MYRLEYIISMIYVHVFAKKEIYMDPLEYVESSVPGMIGSCV